MENIMESLQPHIRCSKDDAAPYAILPGDPARVERVKGLLTDITEIAYNREYKSISGYYKGIKLLVVSTGIGGPSTGIAVEELHNIGVNVMIRIGSCGALTHKLHLGDLLIVNGAVRDEGTSKSYIESIYPAIPDTSLLLYAIQAAEDGGYPFYAGRARSHDSFYTDREVEIDAYWALKGIMGSDMETAALFTIGALRGVKTASILNTVVEWEGSLKEGINSYTDGESIQLKGETNEIITALETIFRFDINKKKSGEDLGL